MDNIIRKLGNVVWIAASIALFVYWVLAMYKWLGILGAIIAVIVSPGAVVFPFVAWFVEGAFPAMYFTILGIGLIGFYVAKHGAKVE